MVVLTGVLLGLFETGGEMVDFRGERFGGRVSLPRVVGFFELGDAMEVGGV